jgi:glycosyltransferase involved in cell wall biosynthesis
MSGRKDLGAPVLRWVTWWPVPYWTDRFDRLAERDEIQFEAVFLAGRDVEYDGLELRAETWRFKYRVLDPTPANIGFYKHRKVPRNPLPIVSGDRSLKLVMSYADPTYVAAATAARVRGVPYSLFVANTEFDQRPETQPRELLKKLMLRNARSILATGPLQRSYALRYAPQARVVELGNPVDPSRVAAPTQARPRIRAELGWAEDQIVLLFVGRLAPEKDLPTLLRAAARLRSGGANVSVAIAGSGPLKDELRDLARDLEVPVDFRGFVNGQPLGELYAGADLFVLPSSSETWGLVVNEAMHAGLPVFVSDHVGSQPLIEPSVNGEVFPCGQAEALEASLVPYVSDSALRGRAAEAARRRIESQTIDNWIDRVLEGVGVS